MNKSSSHFDPDRADYYGPGVTPAPTFFFYDLETSGLSARDDRIMQFAGIRTDLAFNQLGDPVNILVQLTEDTLPSPQAINVTGITPQQTHLDGLSEVEFCRFVSAEIFTPGTIATGYNSIRFDDEFMRHTFWRNFYDPYAWQWKDERSRWDLLDVVRLTRALRPEGINWPIEETTNATGSAIKRATNRLELLTKENHIKHQHAHDALSDVEALIAVTKLIHDRQPQLYDYLLTMRDKKAVKRLVNLERPQAFVYACGEYAASHQKTSVAYPLAPGRNGNVLVFDLRYNLDDLLQAERDFQPETKTTRSGKTYQTKFTFSPMVKELAYNKCPAVAPISVLDSASVVASTDAVNPWPAGTTGWQKLGLTKDQIMRNRQALLAHPEFAERMREQIEQTPEWPPAIDAEAALYDGFVSDHDFRKYRDILSADANRLADFHPEFTDERLGPLLLHYKGKHFPGALSESEQSEWEKYRRSRLARQEKQFVAELTRLQQLAAAGQPNHDGRTIDESILEDLMLWYQSLV